MSGSINKVILIGNLGRDPEVAALQNGDRVVRLSIATPKNGKTNHQVNLEKEQNGIVL